VGLQCHLHLRHNLTCLAGHPIPSLHLLPVAVPSSEFESHHMLVSCQMQMVCPQKSNEVTCTTARGSIVGPGSAMQQCFENGRTHQSTNGIRSRPGPSSPQWRLSSSTMLHSPPLHGRTEALSRAICSLLVSTKIQVCLISQQCQAVYTHSRCPTRHITPQTLPRMAVLRVDSMFCST
jgi:hypothetical protein